MYSEVKRINLLPETELSTGLADLPRYSQTPISSLDQWASHWIGDSVLVVVGDLPSLGNVAICSLVESTRERQPAIVRRGGMGR
jgi:hypothetical protein